MAASTQAKPWEALRISLSPYSGYVRSLEEVNAIKVTFEVQKHRSWWQEFLCPYGRKEPDVVRKSSDRKIEPFEFTPVDHIYRLRLQEMEALKEMPGYKATLKAVLKAQIQMLVEQLSLETDEESVILTACLTDRTLCHLGSSSGKNFLEGREEIKKQFLSHCLRENTLSGHGVEQTCVQDGILGLETVDSGKLKKPFKRPCAGSTSFSSDMAKKHKKPCLESNITPSMKNSSVMLPSSKSDGSSPHPPINPIEFRTAKTQLSFGHSECNRVNASHETTDTSEVTSHYAVKSNSEHADSDSAIHLSDGSSKSNTEQFRKELMKESGITNQHGHCTQTISAPDSVDDDCLQTEDDNTMLFTEQGESGNINKSGEGFAVVKVEPPDKYGLSDSEAGTSEEVLGAEAWETTQENLSDNQSKWKIIQGDLPEFKRIYRRNRKTLGEKYMAILEYEKGERRKSEIAKMFNVPHNTLSSWIRMADSIKEGMSKYDPNRCKMRSGTFAELESELFQWCCAVREQNVQLNGPIILEKAKDLAEQMGLKDCNISTSWLERFKERHRIMFKKSNKDS